MSVPDRCFAEGREAASARTLRHRIWRELPADTFTACTGRAFIACAIATAIGVASVVLATVPLPMAVCLGLSVVTGCLYGSLFFLGHEAGHGSIVRQRNRQEVLMWIAFVIFLLPPTLWRVWHNKVHHGQTNQPDYDPDNFGTLASYRQFRSIRIAAAFTPGSGRWISLLYLPTWFTVHSQIVLWGQSRRCRGFESLNRSRATGESLVMAALWIGLAAGIGAWSSMLVIVLPMMIANSIIMSYIVTNHLLRPLGDGADTLGTSMSVTTHPWMDVIHFNFSHHVEHHLFPAMSPRYAPLVRAKLRRYAGDRFMAPPHLRALGLVFRTPRIHDEHALVDPARGRSVPFADVERAVVSGLGTCHPKRGEP